MTVPLVLLVALVALTVGVVREGRVYRLDDAVLALTPGETGGPTLPHVLAFLVVDLATPAVGVAVVLLVATWLSWRRRSPAPVVVAVPAIVLLTTTVLVGKAVIDRAAPGFDAVVVHDGSYPSGHTATALVCAGVLAEIVSRLRPHRRRAAWTAAAVWTLLVVLGLLWLHFHWLSDVVGSVLLGSLVLWLLLRWPWRLGERIARH
ncbi:phosphatase PAP2 family protein [Intrasporangium sp. YIM S08009]|uniref:phosphatase PAP2 family protein n=1 Tax=Intrasporangium zincisolvens TaxID=3080018 RepID=UPI002B05A51B|nr:phosphatase PAP2 family protein [Intrasporangium sp. YIM S08009]